MSFLESIILGIVQGVTEFVPVSSSGHLVFLRNVFGMADPGIFFDVVLHAGSLLAIIIFFKKTWLKILKSIFVKKDLKGQKLLFNLIIASIPAFIIGFFTEKYIDQYFRTSFSVAISMIFTGIVFLVVEKLSRPKKKVSELSFLAGLLIGLFQAIAIIPGISRSGLTIAGGLLSGLNRKSAAYFSFLLALPVISGANIFEILKVVRNGFNENIYLILIGFLLSFVFSYISIKYFLKFVKNNKLSFFTPYLILIGLLLILLG